jgi:hypothetical protein
MPNCALVFSVCGPNGRERPAHARDQVSLVMPSWGPASRLSPVSLPNPSARDRGQRCRAPQVLLSVSFPTRSRKKSRAGPGVHKSAMATPPRKRRVGSEQRRALQLLASIPFGTTEAVMLTHGFTRRTLADLVHAGFATAERVTDKVDGKAIAGRVRITAVGRGALEDD